MSQSEWDTIFAEIESKTAKGIQWEIERADKIDLCRKLAKILSAKIRIMPE